MSTPLSENIKPVLLPITSVNLQSIPLSQAILFLVDNCRLLIATVRRVIFSSITLWSKVATLSMYVPLFIADHGVRLVEKN